MRLASLLALLFAVSSCGGTSSQIGNKVASAAIGTGIAIAAAGINRAATGDCWATCPTGTRCDKAAGVCIALPCGNRCPADSRCAVIEGRETCAPGGRDVATNSEIPPMEEEPGPGGAATGGAKDPCRGLCFASEQCVEKGGVADCVPRGVAPVRAR